jgi:hypothetical protein
MTTQLHDTGEEAILDDFFEESLSKPASVGIGLFNDSTDSLTDSSTYADITTEPSGGSYAQQSASFGTGDFTNSDSGGDWQAVIADQTFDTSDSSQTVDSYYVTITFTSDDKSDTSSTEHLLFTGSLDQSYDLSNVDSFTLSGAGISLT